MQKPNFQKKHFSEKFGHLGQQCLQPSKKDESKADPESKETTPTAVDATLGKKENKKTPAVISGPKFVFF